MPDEAYLTIGGSLAFDTETTGELGYTYYGSDTDWTGFDDGTLDIPAGLAESMNSGKLIVIGPTFSEEQVQGFTATPANAPTTLIQRHNDVPVTASLNVSSGQHRGYGQERKQ